VSSKAAWASEGLMASRRRCRLSPYYSVGQKPWVPSDHRLHKTSSPSRRVVGFNDGLRAALPSSGPSPECGSAIRFEGLKSVHPSVSLLLYPWKGVNPKCRICLNCTTQGESTTKQSPMLHPRSGQDPFACRRLGALSSSSDQARRELHTAHLASSEKRVLQRRL